MPAPARRTRFGRACHATPSRGAKLFFGASQSAVSCGARVIVAKLSTLFTVAGRVPFGDEGAALYSHRRPYVRVNVRVAFHVSCAKRLTLVKASCTSSFLATMNAEGILLTRRLARVEKMFCAI